MPRRSVLVEHLHHDRLGHTLVVSFGRVSVHLLGRRMPKLRMNTTVVWAWTLDSRGIDRVISLFDLAEQWIRRISRLDGRQPDCVADELWD